jgi:hypothetical protein
VPLLSLIFPSSQILANASVCTRPHLHLLSDTRKCQWLHLASSSPPSRYSQIKVFALSLIFLSSQLLAIPTSVCSWPHLYLFSDIHKYHCSMSASSSPPLRHSQIPVFSVSLVFPSCQILANTSVRTQPGIPLLSYWQLQVFALRLIFPSSQILASTSVRARKCQWLHSGSYIPPLRSQI